MRPPWTAVRKALRVEKPDFVAIAGDLVLNGPDPAGTVDSSARWRTTAR